MSTSIATKAQSWPGTSSQLASGAGTAVTVGAGLTLSGSTLAASGGGGSSVGTYASRPAAGTAGRIYVPTDGPVSFVDDGAQWRPLLPGAVLGTQPAAASTFATRVPASGTTATLTDSFGSLLLDAPTSSAASEAQNTAWFTSKSAALTVTMVAENFAWRQNTSPDHVVGIAFRNASSGKMLAHLAGPGASLFIEYPTITSLPSTYIAGNLNARSAITGLRLVDDGTTNITAYLSPDAATWFQVGQYARNAFNGGGAAAGADQWGIFVRPFNGSGFTRILSLSAV